MPLIPEMESCVLEIKTHIERVRDQSLGACADYAAPISSILGFRLHFNKNCIERHMQFISIYVFSIVCTKFRNIYILTQQPVLRRARENVELSTHH